MSKINKTELKKYFKNFTIMCVEDEEIIRDGYNKMFSRYFKKVFLAEDGKYGIEIFLKEKIDIVVTDQTMPNVTGIEMIKEIRRFDSEVPIILITAYDDTSIVKKALNFDVTHFLKKPIDYNELLSVFKSSIKKKMDSQILKNSQTIDLAYKNMQEKMAFSKQMKIIKYDNIKNTNIDVYYNPLDHLCGDAYSIRYIDENRNLYFIIDAMGKGVAASTTAMISTSFLNHTLDRLMENNNYNLGLLVDEYLNYIVKFILDDEIVSCSIVEQDSKEKLLKVVSFSMPRILMLDKANKLVQHMSKNPPLSKYVKSYKISTIDISDTNHILIASDGLFENKTKDGELFNSKIGNIYQSGRENLVKLFWSQISAQEDDITFIEINLV